MMSNRKEVREQLLKAAGWVEVRPGKWGPPENIDWDARMLKTTEDPSAAALEGKSYFKPRRGHECEQDKPR